MNFNTYKVFYFDGTELQSIEINGTRKQVDRRLSQLRIKKSDVQKIMKVKK